MNVPAERIETIKDFWLEVIIGFPSLSVLPVENNFNQ